MTAGWPESAARHHADHTGLLAEPAPLQDLRSGQTAPEAAVEAVFVPAYREVAGLDHAIGVAAASGAVLVLLCSGHVTAGESLGRVREVTDAVTAVAVDVTGRHGRLVPFATDGHEQATFLRRHDANRKRNLALLLARRAGWRRIMFLNDDVRGLTPDKVRGALRCLDGVAAKAGGDGIFAAAGWAFTDYPDNSVVCHAHRILGGDQKAFISDGSLVFDVSAAMGFFPAVYNEDWLFLFDAVRRGQVALVPSDLHQLPYDPFAEPRRAQAEEFGDVLGEGLVTLLHESGTTTSSPWLAETDRIMVDPTYWRAVVLRRREFIQELLSRLESAGAAVKQAHPGMRTCLESALARHGEDWPEALVSWIRGWREDLRRWHERLEAATPVDCGRVGTSTDVEVLEQALAVMGLRQAARVLPAGGSDRLRSQ